MESQSAVSAGFHMSPVAGGAALSIRIRDAHLNYDVSEALKAKLREEMKDRIEEGHQSFVLDLSAVEVIDSSGVGMLVGLHHQVTGAGGMLGIIGVCPFVTKVLGMMRLDRFLSVHDDMEKALRVVAEPL